MLAHEWTHMHGQRAAYDRHGCAARPGTDKVKACPAADFDYGRTITKEAN